jgi:hypothetical protein
MRVGLGVAGLAALVLAMFHDVLFASGTIVLGHQTTDLAVQFLAWRQFGFGELAKGNIALWNPYIYSGMPFFGGMQSALLYPPNLLFLALPLPLAVNWTIALNVWLLGAFMYLWMLRRGLRPLAAFTCGALLMFCAPHFLHIYAGHLTNLAAMTWVPLIFLSIDEWLRSQRFGWCMLGMAAVAMQILAGHPQYVFYTAIGAALYSAVRLIGSPGRRLAAAGGLLTLHPGGALLAAAQLLIGIQTTHETIRGKPLPFSFASQFPLPPENLVTLVAPGFFGTAPVYWGQWNLWETSLFIGVIGVALALYGAAAKPGMGGARDRTALLVTLVATLVLALGDATPLFRLLYDYAPGFDRFRAIAKFVFVTALILIVLAGHGLERIAREGAVSPRAIWAAGVAGVALLGAASALSYTDWRLFMLSIWATGNTYARLDQHSYPLFLENAQWLASSSLAVAGVTLLVLAALATWLRAGRRPALWIAALAIAEIFFFARANRETFDTTKLFIPAVAKSLGLAPGEYRIQNPINPNTAMISGEYDIWGEDPGVTRRYAEFVAWTEGRNPDEAMQYVRFRYFSSLLSMLRLRFAAIDVEHARRHEMIMLDTALPPFKRLELIGGYRVVHGRDAIFSAMASAAFDPRREVILEAAPRPAPAAAAKPGAARIVREGTDFMDIEAELSSPAVLLVTDAWTPSWRARALPGSAQATYEVMPADYMLRGIPLGAGRHQLRLEYAPRAYAIGWWISALAWLAWLSGWWWLLRSARAQKLPSAAPALRQTGA